MTGHVETQEGRGGLGGDAYEVDGLPRGPRGAVGAGTVTATFYNFNREHVQRYLPAAWSLTTPEPVLAARPRGADGALRRLLGKQVLASRKMSEAAELVPARLTELGGGFTVTLRAAGAFPAVHFGRG
ncbi:hypothetical protein [Streptomyces sp. NPDC046925]|uniref:helix-turn-helix domain-containing protein n=1 Tax=Streptomyces sp. NPDC046925 TaxID=3155375 RepID=UPI0033CC182E